MRKLILASLIGLAGCSSTAFDRKLDGVFGIEREPAEQVAVSAPPPPENATRIEEFDTVSAADRAAATVTVVADDTALGTTIASLGSPVDPGIWLKTPLVNATQMGRVAFEGKAVAVELRPSGRDIGSGSELSLSAMRLLGAPLAGLPEVTVFADG